VALLECLGVLNGLLSMVNLLVK